MRVALSVRILAGMTLLMMMFLGPPRTEARDCTWFGGTGDWETPGHWNCVGGAVLGPPGVGDLAIIAAGIVTVNNPATVSSLSLAAQLNLEANLEVLDGGFWGASTLAGSAELVLRPGSVMSTNAVFGTRQVLGTLRNQGNLEWDMQGWSITGSGTIINEGDFVMTQGVGSTLSAALVNSGTFRSITTTSNNLTGGLTNSGTVTSENGVLIISGPSTTSGHTRVMINGGKVFAVPPDQMPTGTHIAAINRA